jgi:hypothetical protein
MSEQMDQIDNEIEERKEHLKNDLLFDEKYLCNISVTCFHHLCLIVRQVMMKIKFQKTQSFIAYSTSDGFLILIAIFMFFSFVIHRCNFVVFEKKILEYSNFFLFLNILFFVLFSF